MEDLGLLGSEPVGDASSEREHLRDGDGEGRRRGQTAEVGLDVLTEVCRKRVEHRDVRPDRRTAPGEELGPLGLEALLCATVELQGDHQRSLVLRYVAHPDTLPAGAFPDARGCRVP